MNPKLQVTVLMMISALIGVLVPVFLFHDLSSAEGIEFTTSERSEAGQKARVSNGLVGWSGRPIAMPTACSNWADKAPDAGVYDVLSSDGFKRWAVSNPTDAFKLAAKFTSLEMHGAIIGSFFQDLVDADLETARRLAATLPAGSDKTGFADSVAEMMALRDPEAAWRYVFTFPDDPSRISIGFRVAYVVSVMDVQKATDLLERLPLGTVRRELTGMVGKEWAIYDPEAAVEYLIKNEPNDGDFDQLGSLVDYWAKNDLFGAADWIEKLPEGSWREIAVTNLFNHDMAQDSEVVAEMVERFKNAISPKAAGIIAEFWSASDRVAAIKWSETLPVEARVKAVGVIAWPMRWDNKTDYNAWLDSISPGPVRDSALKTAAMGRYGDDSIAIRYAASISDETQKARILRILGNRWMLRDPEAATQWINSSPAISDSLRRDLLMRD